METLPNNEDKTSVLLLSTPRSGSTYISRALHDGYEVNLYDEPLRTTFGNPEHPLYHSRIIGEEDVHDCQADRDVREFFEHMGNKKQTLFKETNGVFQYPFLKKMLPAYRIYFLRRHVFGVVHSIMKIPYWYKKWSIGERIGVFEDELERKIKTNGNPENQSRFEKYRQMYADAKKIEVRDSTNITKAIVHFAVQSIEGQRVADETIDYEFCVKNGINPELFGFWQAREKNPEHERGQHGEYRTHGTKNPSSPYAWLEHFSDDDKKVIREILGQDAELAIPEVHPDERFSQIPNLEWVTVPGSQAQLSNRVISQSDFIKFYNSLIEAGISAYDIEKKLQFRPSETHNFIQSNGSGLQEKYPDRPMTLVSPIIAMAYCLYHGGVLPHPESYKRQRFNIHEYERLLKTANYGDKVGIKKIGQTAPEGGLYDFYGNTSELTLDGLETGFFGGSYQDSVHHLDQQVSIPYMYRTTEIGFRMQKSKNTQTMDIEGLKTILNRSTSAHDVFIALVKLNKNTLQ